MKKRILSLILALSMVLSVLPLGAFAEGSTGELVIGSDGYPIGSNGGKDSCSGNDWEYSNGALYLNLGAFNLSTTEPVKCEIHSFATITGGTFNGKVYNFGTISGGTFQQDVENHGTIKNGTFNGDVTNDTTGKISGGTFASDKKVENKGTIEKGTFEGKVTNSGTIERGTFTGTVINSGTIENGTFASSVTNYGNIDSKGTFNGTVGNGPGGTISNGTFNGTVTNNVGTISGGTFKETVINSNGEITGGTFAGSVTNMYVIYGGVFNGKTGLDRVTGVHSITWDAASPDAKIEKVNGVSANWAPYVVVTKSTPTTAKEVTITADTEIYSLNGQPIGVGNCNSSYGSDKTTVTFTMPNEDVVLSAGELVMENGYPVGSNNGTADCKGNGWKYTKGDTSNPTGKLTLKKSGKYDFSYTYPQNTSKGAGAEPVACAVETQWDVEITGGTFEGEVINNHLGEISGGTFHEKVSNYNGMISGGTFKSSVTSTGNGRIYGGVFNSKTTQKPATDAYSITLDAAYPNAKITEVNDVPADWKPYVVVTKWTKNQEVIITADTDIFSLNGKSIGDGNCKSSYGSDKTVVKFTMPDDDVVLNGAITCTELVMENGYPKASNGGKISCSGTGWAYSKGDASNPTGTLYLMSGSGMFDFSSTHPQGKTQGTQPAPAVACEIEIQSGAEITGGIFDGTVTNNDGGTISGGTFNGTVTNDGTITGNGIFDGTVTNNDGGTISDGTFNGTVTNDGTITGNSTFLEKVTNNQGGNITNGTFNHTVENDAGGTISNGTFEQEVINNAGGEISGGTFKGTVLNGDGIITGGIFAAGLSRNDGSVTGGIFNGDTGLTDARHVTVTNGSLSQVNGVDPRNADGTTGTAWDLYAYKDTTMTITADTDIFSLNGQPIGANNCNSSYGSDKKTVTFTMPNEDVVLNKAITSTDLVMENGYPKDSNGGTIPCKGDGWEYIKNDPTNGDMLLLTDGLFDFSIIGDGSAVECNVFVGKPTAITGGEFNGKVFNNSGILGGTFNGPVENRAPGTIKDGTFHGAVENNGMIENGAFHDKVKNNGTINDGAFHGKVENNSVINSGTFHGEVDNTTMGRIEDGMFNDAVENNGTIEKGTFHDEVKNNGTINSGTFNGAVENNGTINSGTFNGAVTDNGTISGNITGSGTLNGELITKTPEPEPTPKPEPEPTTYTVTVIGGTIDGKTSVSAKENDTLTVVLDQSEVPDGMTFDLWSISSDKLSGDINVDYRAEAMTFPMPAEDVTIRAQYRSAEIIEDAAPSPLATAATVAVGGAAAGIMVWQGVSLGVDLYLTSALPQGVPVPTDRRALALLLWETAGKPEVALPTLYGDVPAEEIELQKATHWAVQNGLMDAADKKDASFFDPDHSVTKMDVFGAWLRLKKLLGTT